MQLSKFGTKFTTPSAINQLMIDLGEALKSNHPDLCMLGGGNPALIPQAQDWFAKEMQSLMDDGGFESMVGNYAGPQGESEFIRVIADYINDQFNWNISPANIALTNGSQNSFFYLFNALAGEMPDGSTKKILFPLAPEYVGYADSGLSQDMFASNRPSIELLDNKQFKYHIDFDKLTIDDDIAAICLSRPTNPTGNVIDDLELAKLDKLAKAHAIPLIIDNAYGQPFPNVIYTDANIAWNDNTVLCMSLSKIGLPGARTGIVIANPEIINIVSSLSAIVTLAPNSIGASMMTRMIKDNKVNHLCDNIIKPFYQKRLDTAISLFHEILGDLPVLMHKPEGAFFLWFWMQDLPISSQELYQRLKAKQVLVIPGEDFFINIDTDWDHTRQCIRINYAQSEDRMRRGFSVLAAELTDIYSSNA